MRRALNSLYVTRNLRRLGYFAAALCLASAAVAAAPARAQEPAADPKEDDVEIREGRLYNLTDRPLVFQLHQKDGAAWTGDYTIPPGKFFAIRAPQSSDDTDIQGLTGNGRGFVIIRYAEPILGGYMTLRLPARNPSSGEIQPTWYAVKDSNGITRMVQEPSIETAKEVQQKLQQQARMSPQELEKVKHMLRANWVLTN